MHPTDPNPPSATAVDADLEQGIGAFVGRGIVGFTLLSIAGFAPWAVAGRWFYRRGGEVGLYVVCAAVFILLSAPLLHRLILGPNSLLRFYKLFSLSFTAYAVLWIAGWMGLHGHVGSTVGLQLGTSAMGWILVQAFNAKRQFWRVALALFVLNSLGYFGGGLLEASTMRLEQAPLVGRRLNKSTRGMLAKTLWGVCYGAGFGAGLGLAFYLCQSPSNRRQSARP